MHWTAIGLDGKWLAQLCCRIPCTRSSFTVVAVKLLSHVATIKASSVLMTVLTTSIPVNHWQLDVRRLISLTGSLLLRMYGTEFQERS